MEAKKALQSSRDDAARTNCQHALEALEESYGPETMERIRLRSLVWPWTAKTLSQADTEETDTQSNGKYCGNWLELAQEMTERMDE